MFSDLMEITFSNHQFFKRIGQWSNTDPYAKWVEWQKEFPPIQSIPRSILEIVLLFLQVNLVPSDGMSMTTVEDKAREFLWNFTSNGVNTIPSLAKSAAITYVYLPFHLTSTIPPTVSPFHFYSPHTALRRSMYIWIKISFTCFRCTSSPPCMLLCHWWNVL